MQFGDYVATPASRANGVVHEHEGTAFLRWLDAGGRHNLVALDPAGGAAPDARTFEAGAWHDMDRWIRQRQGRLNVYFSANEPAADAPHKKLAEPHIGAIRAIYADIDPVAGRTLDEERTRISALAAGAAGEPTVVDSGNGYQLIWRLPEKLDPHRYGDAARTTGRGIADAFGGDRIFDLPRILRLPGTMNLPTKKKLAAGRKPALARLEKIGAGLWSLTELSRKFPAGAFELPNPDADEEIAKAQASLDMTAIYGTISIDDLSSDVRARFRRLLDTDEHARRLWEGDEHHLGKDKSRSAFRAALAASMGRAGGFTAQDFGEVLFAWDYAVGDNQDPSEVLDARTIARDWQRCGWPRAPERFFGPVAEREPTIWDAAPHSTPTAPAFFPPVQSISSIPDAAALPPRDWLIEPWCPANTVNAIVGAPGVSKSAFALLLAVAIASGREALLAGAGSVAKSGPVLVYNREDDVAEMKRRVAGICIRHDLRDFPHRLHLASGIDGARLVIVERDKRSERIRRAPGFDGLRERIRELRPVLVILDPLVSLSAGLDENSNDDMEALLAELRVLASSERVTILVVHHGGKNADKMSGELGASRGASSIVGAIRGGVTLTAWRVTGSETSSPYPGLAPGHYVIVEGLKANYGPKTDAAIYRLRSLPIGNGSADGDGGDKVAVHELVDRHGAAATATAIAADRDTRHALAIAQIVDEVLGDRSEATLNGELAAITPRLEAQNLQRGTSRQHVVDRLSEMVGGPGVEFFDPKRQRNVRISMRKMSDGKTSPWIIRRDVDSLHDLFA